jgi:hypothetical protein
MADNYFPIMRKLEVHNGLFYMHLISQISVAILQRVFVVKMIKMMNFWQRKMKV